jgi:hypothetical protein
LVLDLGLQVVVGEAGEERVQLSISVRQQEGEAQVAGEGPADEGEHGGPGEQGGPAELEPEQRQGQPGAARDMHEALQVLEHAPA